MTDVNHGDTKDTENARGSIGYAFKLLRAFLSVFVPLWLTYVIT